jgi:hypothetical protein
MNPRARFGVENGDAEPAATLAFELRDGFDDLRRCGWRSARKPGQDKVSCESKQHG